MGGKQQFKLISSQLIPKSEHIAGDVCVFVIKAAIAHCSPSAVVVDLETSRIWQSVVTSKSHQYYTHTHIPLQQLLRYSTKRYCCFSMRSKAVRKPIFS